MADWVSLAASALGAGIGAWQSNKNVNKQIQYQKQENEKIRAYNLQLAKMQNKWNLQLMHSQNAYNSPSAQIMRMKEAGLNPDMMYGSGVSGNLSASSAPMTSGSPATPMDFTALSNKKTVGQAIMEGLSIAQARANVEKTEAEADAAGTNADILAKYGLETAELNREYVREQANKLAEEAQGIDYSNTLKEIESTFAYAYRHEIMENYIQRLKTSTGLSKNDLEEDIKTLAMRIAGINAENSKLDRMSKFTTDEWKLVFEAVKWLIGLFK